MTIDIDDDVEVPVGAVKRDRMANRVDRIKSMYIDGMAPLTIAAKLNMRLETVKQYCNYDA